MRFTRIKHWILNTAAVLLVGTLAASPATATPPVADDLTAVEVELKRETKGVEATLEAAFKAALARDFDAYLATIHADERSTPAQIKSIRRYAFKRFTKQAAWYLKSGDVSSFEITKRQVQGNKARVFIKDLAHPARMAVPVRLKKNADGTWSITANSL